MSFVNILAGFLTGVAASMGFGGGFILIIYLTAFANLPQSAAGGINLLFFLPVAAVSLIIHTKNKLVDWKGLPLILLFGAAGAGAGALLVNVLNESLLEKLFAVLLTVAGIREVCAKP